MLISFVSNVKAQVVGSIDEMPSWSVDKPVMNAERVKIVSESWQCLFPQSTRTRSLWELAEESKTSSFELFIPYEDSESADEKMPLEEYSLPASKSFQSLVADKVSASIPMVLQHVSDQDKVGRMVTDKLDLIIHYLVEDQLTMLDREIFDWVVKADKNGFNRSQFAALSSFVLYSLMEIPCPIPVSELDYQLSWIHFLSMVLDSVSNSMCRLEEFEKKKLALLKTSSGSRRFARSSLDLNGTVKNKTLFMSHRSIR